MKKPLRTTLIIWLVIEGCLAGCIEDDSPHSSFQMDFNLEARTLVHTGQNPYFILEPDFQLVWNDEDKKRMSTVLDETREFNGIMTRIVEEREWENNRLIKISQGYYAICEKTQDVFCFGKEIDIIKSGKISHDGTWLAGEKNANPGLVMPGRPQIGQKYYQAIAPGVSMDRAEIMRLDAVVSIPVGKFSHCLVTKDGSAFNILERKRRIYALGVGLVRDDDFQLTQYGFAFRD